MARWSYEGGLLMFQELPIENPNDIIERAGILHIIHEREHRMRDGAYKPTFDEQGREVFPLNVTFLAFIFLYEELIITGGDDGYVRPSLEFSLNPSSTSGRTSRSLRRKMHTLTRPYSVCQGLATIQVSFHFFSYTRFVCLRGDGWHCESLGNEQP